MWQPEWFCRANLACQNVPRLKFCWVIIRYYVDLMGVNEKFCGSKSLKKMLSDCFWTSGYSWVVGVFIYLFILMWKRGKISPSHHKLFRTSNWSCIEVSMVLQVVAGTHCNSPYYSRLKYCYSRLKCFDFLFSHKW